MNYTLKFSIFIFLVSCATAHHEKNREPEVDASTLTGKFMFGYQGWFSTPNDGSNLKNWMHWTKDRKAPNINNMAVDLWPDTSEFNSEELTEIQLRLPNGKQAVTFSSYNTQTVRRHFQWMKTYGLDGVFLQRFVVDTDPLKKEFGFRNQVLRNVGQSAIETGRVFAVTYDISGAKPDNVVNQIKQDWMFLVDHERVLENPRYLHHNGKPLLALWGFGFAKRGLDPAATIELMNWLTTTAPEKYRVSIMGGVPTYWRDGKKDSDSNSLWQQVYRKYSVISPWMVGRVKSEKDIQSFVEAVIKPDIEETARYGITYMPVVFPGFSWANLKGGSPNSIPRSGGSFYWKQISAYTAAGASTLYGAMFDELDEGTAIMKMAATSISIPTNPKFISLGEDGYHLPTDWFLKLSGAAAVRIKSKTSMSDAFSSDICASENNSPLCDK